MGGDEIGLAASSLASFTLILGVLAGALWLARRLRGTKWGRAEAASPIHLVATRALGGQHMLVLAEVEGQRILIGVSRGAMTALARVDARE
jgi:flagellar biogenesis protein FliO